ncbi:MAG: hypothetical protein JW818_17355 [Pirellulales bacterium]|nr:hypothetical protein [Pirellulales bacterium]
MLGVHAVIWSTDVRRYRPLILSLAVFCLVGAVAGLIALFVVVAPPDRARTFWIIFIDLAEGLAHLTLLLALTLRVPRYEISCAVPEKKE